MANWKTTISGAAVIITGIVMIVLGHSEIGIPLIPVGVGLLCAKDYNVTGGTKEQ